MVNVVKWDKRIMDDYSFRTSNFDEQWKRNLDMLNNIGGGAFYGNLVKEFGQALRAKLIAQNFVISVKSDDPDFAQKSEEVQIMANSLARSIDMKDHLDNASEFALVANTGWLEVGHTLDFHSFDPHRSLMYNVGKFDAGTTEEQYEEVSEKEVRMSLGEDIDDVAPFDPFSAPIDPEPVSEGQMTFDPDFGTPWIKSVHPFQIVIPKNNSHPSNCEYITKLMVLSYNEVLAIAGDSIDEEELRKSINLNKNKHHHLYSILDDSDFIDDKIVIAVTFIRWDRNNPENNNSYLVHVLGNPSLVIKESVNPFGGMIPFVAIKSTFTKKTWDKSWVEDIEPYAKKHGKIVEAVFKRARRGLTHKWIAGNGVTVGKASEKKINSPTYEGRIDVEGNIDGVKQFESSALTQDMIALINLTSKLAQGEAGQTDIDRGTPVKKITARQTEALLKTSAVLVEVFRTPVAKAATEAILKVIHLLTLFSAPSEKVYTFGNDTVQLNPNGSDYSTSFKYNITASDMGGASSSESQLLWSQLLKIIGSFPGLSQQYDIRALANETRRRFGAGVEIMATPIAQQPGQVPGMTGENLSLDGSGQNELLSDGGDRDLLSQGGPDGSLSNALGGIQ